MPVAPRDACEKHLLEQKAEKQDSALNQLVNATLLSLNHQRRTQDTLSLTSVAGGLSTFVFFGSGSPLVGCCMLLISVNAGRETLPSVGAARFSIDGGLYAFLFAGLCWATGAIRLAVSTAGVTEPDLRPPLLAGGPGCKIGIVGTPISFRRIGADLRGSTPCVRRIEGLSACGSKGTMAAGALPLA